MGRIKIDLIRRRTGMNKNKRLKSKLNFNSLSKIRKQNKTFMISALGKNEDHNRIPSQPTGFVVTDSISQNNEDETLKEEAPIGQPTQISKKYIFIDDKFIVRREYSIIKEDCKEDTYFVDEPVKEDYLDEDGEFTSRVDELNQSWNLAYGDIPDPGTPRRVSFGAPQDIVVDKLRWSKKALRNARKGPWLKLAFMKKQSCQSSWDVHE